MLVLEACPNLIRFYCMVPVDLAKFLEIKAAAPRLEDLSASPVLPYTDSLSDEEKLQWEEQLLGWLTQYSELKRFELANRGALGYLPGATIPLDTARAAEAMSNMKNLEFISLYGHEYANDGSKWNYTKRRGAR
ncbi:hypothetical protein BGZ81_010107 [Podila clonocystis]|nr:hypothetical protein BGZ81_010107 [Podila clonocystis]